MDQMYRNRMYRNVLNHTLKELFGSLEKLLEEKDSQLSSLTNELEMAQQEYMNEIE